MRKRYWILISYLGVLCIAPWVTDTLVTQHVKQYHTGSWLLEILYSIILKGVWMWAYALFIAVLIGMGLLMIKSKERNEMSAGFRMIGILHAVLMIALVAYSFLADGIS